MKVIYVLGDRANDALNFKKQFGINPSIQLWNQIKQNEYLEIETKEGTEDISVRALEFGEVDPVFVGFIKSTLLDDVRHQDIFVVKED